MKNLKCLIVGEGELKGGLLRLIKKFKLEDNVFILKPVKNVLLYYLACDFFVLPSTEKSEAFGIVLIEAMACGKPIISTELGTGTSWINQNGETGFVVPPKDSKALYSAIQKIINNKKLAQELGQNGYQRVLKYFTLERMLRETKAVYLALINKWDKNF